MGCLVDWSGWANTLIECNGDTVNSTASTVCYLQNNLGILNSLLGTSFNIVSGGSGVHPCMTNLESGILNEMFFCHSYRKMAHQNLGAAGCDVTSIEGPGGDSFRKVSKTETAKVARGLYKDCQETLDKLVNWHKARTRALPSQVVYTQRYGQCTVRVPQIIPPDGYYSAHNIAFR